MIRPEFASKEAFSVFEGNSHVPEISRGHKKWSFRRWQVLLFFLVLAVIVIVMGLLIAMFGPGNPNLEYSAKRGKDATTVAINGAGSLVHIISVATDVCVVAL